MEKRYCDIPGCVAEGASPTYIPNEYIRGMRARGQLRARTPYLKDNAFDLCGVHQQAFATLANNFLKGEAPTVT